MLRSSKDDFDREHAAFVAATEADKKRKLEELCGHPCQLGVTMQAYGMLQPGMSETRVNAIISFDGKEQSSYGNLLTKVWQNGSKAIIVNFQNRQLVGKSQIGL